jgi:alpha-L-rhamnosidase
MRILIRAILLCFLLLAQSFVGTLRASGEELLSATHLRCEYLENPLGIDAIRPRLSWRLESDVRGRKQSAYRILVASSLETLGQEKGDLWDTGRVESDQTIHVVYSGQELAPGDFCFWMVKVWDRDGNPSPWSRPAYWSVGPLEESDWEARWIGTKAPAEPTNDPLPAQMLRKEFLIEGSIQRAVVHVSALGVYELRLNGDRVGDRILAPEWTDYHKRVQYQTIDITRMLREGNNAVAARLGDGWYAGRIGLANQVPDGPARGIYGPRPRLLVQLEVENASGEIRRVVTDESWRVTAEGPIRTSDILDGEYYDARREAPGWDQPGFDDSLWTPVVIEEEVKAGLVSQPNEPIRVVEELIPIAVTEPEPGVFIFDLGQNMAGWCRISGKGRKGQEIRLRHAEVLNPDGTLYRDNLRIPKDGGPWGARQEDFYVFRGEGTEVFEPHFTYHGFRYVEVTGLEEKPGPDFLTGRVFCSSASETLEFECSNPMLNQLMRNILWTQRANLMSVPTDCPQRDERLGWMGDAQVFSPAACFNMDMAGFFTKWLQDVRDAQADDGRFPDFAPNPFDPNKRFSGVPAWADAGVIVPWVVYQWYGDKRLLEKSFDSARRWVDTIHEKNPDLIWRHSRGNDYGDWLNGDTLIREGWPTSGGQIPKEVFATLFFMRSANLVSRMADVLGREEEMKLYHDLANRIRAAFVSEFVSADGKIEGDTQAGYALALAFDALPEERRAAALNHLVEAIEKYDRHISTGFVSTIAMMNELTNRGRNDIAYRLLSNRTFPSWGYTIDQGATTIWERWDGYVEGRGFQDPGMNSFSHYAIGAVGEWMVRSILGINPDPAHPGFERIRIQPRPGGKLTWARGTYHSIRGPIRVDWKLGEGNRFQVDVEIPANTTAEVCVPAAEVSRVKVGGKSAADAEGIELLSSESGTVNFEIGSGFYSFADDSGL